MVGIKRRSIQEVYIEETIYPGIGVGYLNNKKIRIKHALPGQKVKVKIHKKKKDYYIGRLLEVIKRSSKEIKEKCNHFKSCGGCNQQTLPYDIQLIEKEKQMKKLFKAKGIDNFQGLLPSPRIFEYRNKMEFSFGDLEKDGLLQLGLHPRGRRFDVITVDSCVLVDNDFRAILSLIIEYMRKHKLKRYHVKNRQGFLRNLVIRKGLKTGEILVNLITTSQLKHDFSQLSKELKMLPLQGELVGFLQTINDDYADAVKCDRLIIHYGRDFYFEELLNLRFKIKPFSFFQPNTYAAEVLYKVVKDFLGHGKNKFVFDLYCGTGSISQVIAADVNKVIGIEIIEEAVEMARENLKINKIKNCSFINGDVQEKLFELKEVPDLIIVDPPRPGIHPAALNKIIEYGCHELIYVSCNPRTLVRDLNIMQDSGYKVNRFKCVDMFPHTNHIESVAYLSK